MPGVLDKVFHMLTKDAAAARIDAAAPAANARKPAGCKTDPLTAYLVLLNNNLSDRFDTPKAFHDHLAQLREKLEAQKNAATELVEPLLLKPRVTIPGGHAVLSPDQLWRINRDLFDYNEELQKTLKTHWADNPAPKFGTCWIDVDKSGEWGGFDHSLEVRRVERHTELKQQWPSTCWQTDYARSPPLAMFTNANLQEFTPSPALACEPRGSWGFAGCHWPCFAVFL